MSYLGARNLLTEAQRSAEDDGVRKLAEALIKLTRAIESDINRIENELRAIKSRV